jgi:hypothetical protein
MEEKKSRPSSRAGAIAIVLLWLAVFGGAVWYWYR